VNRSLPRVLSCALATFALVGTLLVVSSAATGPGYHQPKGGSCHDLTLRQANARSAPLKASLVDCDERHTYITLVVKQLSGPVDWNAPDIWRGVFGPCARKAQRVLGNNDKARAMSAYQLFSFIPTKKERARGAKWKVCGLGLFGGRTLQPLPEKLDLGRLPLDDSVARCYAGPNDALRITVCAKRHTWRATGGFRVTGKTYPGERKLTRLALQRCPKLTSSRTYRYELPFNADQWRVGYRTIVCFTKTRK
jgi:hypothetical protein